MSEIITQIKDGLKTMAFLDIKRASAGGAKMGAFILASCFIDYMAGYRYNQANTGQAYMDFVNDYLPATYDKEKLYKDLRCKLVHNYSEGGSYLFIHGDTSKHGVTVGSKKVINLENFINDLEVAMDKFFHQIDEDTIIQQKAIDRFNSISILEGKTILIGSPSVTGTI